MCPVRFSSLSPNTWQPKKLKFYPHFDKFLSMRDAVNLVTNPASVAKHAFFPFLLFEEGWRRYGVGGQRKTRRKTRLIQYAARSDSYIYEYYRYLLSAKYECKLLSEDISYIPVAYRKIRNAQGAGSSNIDFAREAFEQVLQLKTGYVVALDIKAFFDNIDHEYLKLSWAKLIDVDRLPSDHFAVFKAITKYSSVEKQDLYNALGIPLSATKGAQRRGRKRLVSQCQICSTDEFRQKVCGERNRTKKIITPNKGGKGIPQGSPISDLLANLVMFEFDILMNKFCKQNQIYYRRYSDDLIFVIPDESNLINGTIEMVNKVLESTTKTLKISDQKTRIHRFEKYDDKIKITQYGETTGPIEYLGFQFDGKYALFRSSTLSNISRKIKKAAYAFARSMVRKFPKKSTDELLNGISKSVFTQKFFKIKNFETKKNFQR